METVTGEGPPSAGGLTRGKPVAAETLLGPPPDRPLSAWDATEGNIATVPVTMTGNIATVPVTMTLPLPITKRLVPLPAERARPQSARKLADAKAEVETEVRAKAKANGKTERSLSAGASSSDGELSDVNTRKIGPMEFAWSVDNTEPTIAELGEDKPLSLLPFTTYAFSLEDVIVACRAAVVNALAQEWDQVNCAAKA